MKYENLGLSFHHRFNRSKETKALLNGHTYQFWYQVTKFIPSLWLEHIPIEVIEAHTYYRQLQLNTCKIENSSYRKIKILIMFNNPNTKTWLLNKL